MSRLGYKFIDLLTLYRADKEADFPILCESCLGENPYLRMTRESHGKECKICSRPFTIFKWNPGKANRLRKTEICQLCAKLKNACQSCVLDLDYKLPTQVRDEVLKSFTDMPSTAVNAEYYIQNMEKTLDSQDNNRVGKADSAAKELIKKMSRSSASPYESTKTKVCTMFAAGQCNKGSYCPFRHEASINTDKSIPTEDNTPAVNQETIKAMIISAPADKSICTLYLTGIVSEITESDIKYHFSKFGSIKSVTLLTKAKCAFLTFTDRIGAELAVENTMNKIVIKGHAVRVQWGKSPNSNKNISRVDTSNGSLSVQDLLAMPSSIAVGPPPPGSTNAMNYPSMNPKMMGTFEKTYKS